MMKALARALISPFRHPGAAFCSAAILIGVPMVLLLAVGIAQQPFLWRLYGAADPVFFQHVVWFFGARETLQVIAVVSVVVCGPFAVARWWRGLSQRRERYHWRQVGQVALWLWLGMSVLLLNGVYFALTPGEETRGADPIVWLGLVAVGLTILARTRTRLFNALGPEGGQAPGWAKSVGAAFLILCVGVVFQVLGLLVWVGMTHFIVGGPFGAGGGTASWVGGFVLFQWQQILALLAFAYAALVAIAVFRMMA